MVAHIENEKTTWVSCGDTFTVAITGNILKKSLGSDLRSQALFSNLFSDIQFDVSGTIFCGHRVVLLSQAPDFLRSLNGETNVIVDWASPNSFRKLFEFLYSGTISRDIGSILKSELIEISERYFFIFYLQFYY